MFPIENLPASSARSAATPHVGVVRATALWVPGCDWVWRRYDGGCATRVAVCARCLFTEGGYWSVRNALMSFACCCAVML